MALERINLYDSEMDLLIEADVSPSDAQRAATDVSFATELLQRLRKQQTETEHSRNNYDDFFNDFIDEDNENNDENTNDSINYTTQESEVSLYRWSPPCVLLLLEAFRSMEETLNSGKMSQKKVWEEVARQLALKGYEVTALQCSSKLRSLKKTYKSIKDHNNKSGNDRRSWQFFEIMEDIFAKKAWCNPVAVASSSGLSTKTTVEDSDSGCSIKHNKPTITSLLGKRLKQREEHEKQKMKRHQERLEMDAKFLKVLEKLLEK